MRLGNLNFSNNIYLDSAKEALYVRHQIPASIQD
jgi:hypothetical protein